MKRGWERGRWETRKEENQCYLLVKIVQNKI